MLGHRVETKSSASHETESDFSRDEKDCKTAEMSLLTRLQATEAQRRYGTASAQTPSTPDDKENLDPRAKMMKEIQAMLDGYGTGPTEGGKPPAGNGQDSLSSKLKSKLSMLTRVFRFCPGALPASDMEH